ncbi:unnamed protein product, partial [Vitis vinifera]|uniref:Uncharacterized protein n=1 Tax=Vitis vinifera TaxID=29760 RepID=D7T2T3_VITVI
METKEHVQMLYSIA